MSDNRFVTNHARERWVQRGLGRLGDIEAVLAGARQLEQWEARRITGKKMPMSAKQRVRFRSGGSGVAFLDDDSGVLFLGARDGERLVVKTVVSL